MTSSSKPSHHTPSGFQNPWPSKTTVPAALSTMLRIPITRARSFETIVEPAKTVPCNFDLFNSQEQEHRKSICATWLGHAGFLVQLPRLSSEAEEKPTRIIFDPIFAERASPSTWIGPRRYLPVPCEAGDLPVVDYVVISHNHYDHLDIECLRQIHQLQPTVHFIVPLGVKSILCDELAVRDELVHDLDWWATASFPSPSGNAVEFICTPAQHNSGRGIIDQRSTLWASWVVRQFSSSTAAEPSTSIYFAGDTGYATATGPCPVFAEIGSKYGPFDFAMIPIWRGASLSLLGRLGFRLTPGATETLLSTLHASPADAVELATDVGATRWVPMHFGTFCGSTDEAKEPLVLLVEALQRKGVKWLVGGRWNQDGCRRMDVGETVLVPRQRRGILTR